MHSWCFGVLLEKLSCCISSLLMFKVMGLSLHRVWMCCSKIKITMSIFVHDFTLSTRLNMFKTYFSSGLASASLVQGCTEYCITVLFILRLRDSTDMVFFFLFIYLCTWVEVWTYYI